MENYFASQRDHIFRNVEVLIYVFDVESRELEKDMHYYQSCLEAILQNSKEAKIFCLLHKMDLIQEDQRDQVPLSFSSLSLRPGLIPPCLFPRLSTIARLSSSAALSRWTLPAFALPSGMRASTRWAPEPDFISWESSQVFSSPHFSQAWSSIVYSLIPNVKLLESHLLNFCNIWYASSVKFFLLPFFQNKPFPFVDLSEADEIVLFERATFLVISHSTRTSHRDTHRFEKISNIIKQFKLSCRFAPSSLHPASKASNPPPSSSLHLQQVPVVFPEHGGQELELYRLH